MSPRVSESFRYAFNKKLVALYIIAIIGERMMAFSHTIPLARSKYGFIISTPVFLVGLALTIGSVVGVLHQLLTDALEKYT